MQVETIFDHAVTQDELAWLFGQPITLEEYDVKSSSQDNHYARIYKLYLFRSDENTAAKYLAKIKDTHFRDETETNDVPYII